MLAMVCIGDGILKAFSEKMYNNIALKVVAHRIGCKLTENISGYGKRLRLRSPYRLAEVFRVILCGFVAAFSRSQTLFGNAIVSGNPVYVPIHNLTMAFGSVPVFQLPAKNGQTVVLYKI